jgi:hypothetical protein
MKGLFLHSVLLDKAERQSVLTVNHKEGSQRERLMAVLDERSKADGRINGARKVYFSYLWQ